MAQAALVSEEDDCYPDFTEDDILEADLISADEDDDAHQDAVEIVQFILKDLLDRVAERTIYAHRQEENVRPNEGHDNHEAGGIAMFVTDEVATYSPSEHSETDGSPENIQTTTQPDGKNAPEVRTPIAPAQALLDAAVPAKPARKRPKKAETTAMIRKRASARIKGVEFRREDDGHAQEVAQGEKKPPRVDCDKNRAKAMPTTDTQEQEKIPEAEKQVQDERMPSEKEAVRINDDPTVNSRTPGSVGSESKGESVAASSLQGDQEQRADRANGKKSFSKKSASSVKKRKKGKNGNPVVVERERPSATDSPGPSSVPVVLRPPPNWRKVLRLSAHAAAADTHVKRLHNQLLKSALPTYVPCVPPGTSDRLVAALKDDELEQLVCPSCRDRFLLPTSFFSHIYRKSVSIHFRCQPCATTLTFNNPCHLKLHVLSHIEAGSHFSSVATSATSEEDSITLLPAEKTDLHTGYCELQSVEEAVLDQAYADAASVSSDRLVQCTECRLYVRRDNEELSTHFERAPARPQRGRVYECDKCCAILGNACSLSAHKRIHSKTSPLTCPECGQVFRTWSVFQSHVQAFCLHERRTFSVLCRLCSAHVRPSSLLSHFYDKHVKLLYKCSGCATAFDSKTAIHDHRTSEHGAAAKSGPDFKLLYKAKFLVESNVFSSREAIEDKIRRVTRKWPRARVLSCESCGDRFNDRNHFLRHDRRWCRFQKHGVDEPNEESTSKLFPAKSEARKVDAEKALEAKLADLREMCPRTCSECDELLSALRIHFGKHIDKAELLLKDTGERAPLGQSSCTAHVNGTTKSVDAAQDVDPVPCKRLRRSATSSVQQEAKAGSGSSSAARSMPPPAAPKSATTPEQPSDKTSASTNGRIPAALPFAIPKKKSGKKVGQEQKPFVESLGIGVPGGKELLALNNLGGGALYFGSSIAKGADVCKSQRPTGKSYYECSVCAFTAPTRPQFLTHIRTHRPGDGSSALQCSECGTFFASERAWSTHRLLIHRIKRDVRKMDISHQGSCSQDANNPNECSVCSLQFETGTELRKHFRCHGMAFLQTSKTSM